MFPRDVFVPNGDSRRDTAIILVGTAEEYGIDQRSIKSTAGGFYITNELAALVYDDDEPMEMVESESEPEPVKAPAKKTTAKKASTKKASGNRAAKKDSEEE